MRKAWLVVACSILAMVNFDVAYAGGRVYALRGLINVFSYGMDAMVDKCRSQGITATAHGHSEYRDLAAEAAKFAKSHREPIIIIGHSLGADAAVSMVKEMKELGAPVALLVLFGPTVDAAIPSNVRSVLNYYQTTNLLWRGKAVGESGFKGSIRNINLDKDEDVTHFNIEKLERLQKQAMARIVALTGTGRRLPPADTATSLAAKRGAAASPKWNTEEAGVRRSAH